MGGAQSPPATVANPRHAALAQALARAKTLQPPVDARLDPLVSAMVAKAWTGGTSDAFIADLNGNKRALHTASQGCIDNLQDALRTCPATVPNPQASNSQGKAH